jgi:hypothetical protein
VGGLVGKLIDLAAVRATKPRYERAPRIAITAPAPLFMLDVRLTTPAHAVASDEPRIATAFGDLYFRAGPPMRRP